MDLMTISSALQFPMVVMTGALAVLLAMRAHRVLAGAQIEAHPGIKLALAGFLAALTLRQGYWHLFWTMRANDLGQAAVQMIDAPWFPASMNAIALLFGGACIALAGRPTLGHLSTPAVGASIVVLLMVGAGMSAGGMGR